MAAAVDLQEHARLGHPLATEPVAPGSPAPYGRQAGLGEDPAQRALGHHDALTLREQVREMGTVHPRVRRRRELREPCPQRLVESVRRDPSLVAVDERCGTLLGVIARQEPPQRAHREVKVGGRFLRGQLTGQDVVEHPEALLCPSVHVIVSLVSMSSRVTKSLAAYG